MATPQRVFFWLLSGITVLGLPPVILLSLLYLLMSPSYVRFEYGKASFPSATRLNESQRFSAAVECIRYLRSDVGIEVLRTLEDGEGPLFNDRELQHMLDVKEVTRAIMTFHGICMVLVTGAVLFSAYYSSRGEFAKRLVQGSGLTLALVGILLITAMVNFNWFFTMFHRVFFEGDTWLFSYTDTLIQLFPIPFWFDVVLLWVLGVIVESCAIGGLALWWLRHLSTA